MLELETLLSKCEEILKSLPIAHYLKVRTIPVEFSTSSDTSYFDPKDYKIVIALNNILSSLSGKKILNDLELEKTIRCFLYHEVSHAILTPNDLMPLADRFAKSSEHYLLNPMFANVIEDERIETILSHYYLDVDFKQNLRDTCPIDKHIKSFEHFVFNVVRHRCSPILPVECNRLVDSFIESTKKINSFSSAYDLARRMEALLTQLKLIFDRLPKEKDPDSSSSSEEKSTEKTESSSSEENSEGKSTSKNSSEEENSEKSEEKENNSSEQSQEDCSKESDPTEADSKDQAESKSDSRSELEKMEEKAKPLTSNLESTLSSEEIESIMDSATDTIKQVSVYTNAYNGKKPNTKISDFSYEKSTKCEMLKIIGRNAGFGINKTPTQYGYNGKFNTKRFATDFNDSCKWFAKRAYEETGANNRKNSKKTLNIWLDNSGSYASNDIETNKILSALVSIEKSRDDFKFNLITFDTHFYKKTGEDRISCSIGGNALPKKEIDSIYKETNQNGTELNIVLFDGSAVSDSYSTDTGYQSLRVFNNNKAIFITESSNVNGIKRFCPKCKALIEENRRYCDELKRNILRAFDLLF